MWVLSQGGELIFRLANMNTLLDTQDSILTFSLWWYEIILGPNNSGLYRMIHRWCFVECVYCGLDKKWRLWINLPLFDTGHTDEEEGRKENQFTIRMTQFLDIWGSTAATPPPFLRVALILVLERKRERDLTECQSRGSQTINKIHRLWYVFYHLLDKDRLLLIVVGFLLQSSGSPSDSRPPSTDRRREMRDWKEW